MPRSEDNVLIVGDARLGFARLIGKHRHDKGHVGITCASTYEDAATLSRRYPGIETTILELEGLNVMVHHELDCTWLENKLTFLPDLIYFNFPHAGKPDKVKGIRGDGHPWLLWRHKNLMLLFFRAAYLAISKGARVCVSTGIRSWCCSENDLKLASRMSGFAEIHREVFFKFPLGGYTRSFGDWRDDGRAMVTTDNIYPEQDRNNEVIFTFQRTEHSIPALPLWDPAPVDSVAHEVVTCSCGVVAPLDQKRTLPPHFGMAGDHQEMKGEEHKRVIWECMYDEVMNGQDGMRRKAMGEDSFLQGSCSNPKCKTPADEARSNALLDENELPICRSCFEASLEKL
jgi:hypothetical protein